MDLHDDMVFKFLAEDGSSFHGGYGKWNLPLNGKQGKWMPELKGKIVACSYGYHLCRKDDLLKWFAPRLFVAESAGDIVTTEDKIVVQRARLVSEVETWNVRTIVLFACDCAEHTLANFEKQFPDDKRARNAIDTARLIMDGKATVDQARSAAESAGSAAESAAWSASSAWSAAESAGSAAESAWSAWSAESAAESARSARSAAESAAESARSAAESARSAAWSAARSAAWSARSARSAEYKWQIARLWEYLEGKR